MFGKGADYLTIALTYLFVPAPLVAVTVTSALGSWHHGPDVLPVTLPRKMNNSLIGPDAAGLLDIGPPLVPERGGGLRHFSVTGRR